MITRVLLKQDHQMFNALMSFLINNFCQRRCDKVCNASNCLQMASKSIEQFKQGVRM